MKRADNLKDHIRRKHPEQFDSLYPKAKSAVVSDGPREVSIPPDGMKSLGPRRDPRAPQIPSWRNPYGVAREPLMQDLHENSFQMSQDVSTKKFALDQWSTVQKKWSSCPPTPTLFAGHSPAHMQFKESLLNLNCSSTLPHSLQTDHSFGTPNSHEPQIPEVAVAEKAGSTETAPDSYDQVAESLQYSRPYGEFSASHHSGSLGRGGGPPPDDFNRTCDLMVFPLDVPMHYTSTSPPDDDSTRQQSLAMERQPSRDTVMTDDTVQFPWNFDDRFTMSTSHPFLSVESLAVQEVVNGLQHWNLGGGTADASGSLSISSSPTTKQQSKATNPWKRPSRDGADGEGSDNNGKDGPPLKKRGRKKVLEGQPRLACHFQKRFPERHPMCGGFTLIAYVKGHLRSKHTRSPYYCPRCNKVFKTDDARDEHIELIISSPCKKQAYDTSTEISASMAEQLHKRVEQSSELCEQWFSVWDTIFPGVPRPPTHTYDICSDLPIQVLGLYTYLETEGPGTIVSFLQRRGLVIAPKTPQLMPPDLETYIRRVLFQACREIYQNWQSQREQASPANSSPSNVSNTGPNTPMDTETGRNTTGDYHVGFGPSPQIGTTTVPCTSSSASTEGIDGISLPTNTNSRKMGCVSASASQNQSIYLSPNTPKSMYDGNSNGSGLPRRDSTASGGSSMLGGHTPQDGSLATLQYSYEYEHIADTVFEFDMPEFQDFNPDFQEPSRAWSRI